MYFLLKEFREVTSSLTDTESFHLFLKPMAYTQRKNKKIKY